MSLSLFDAMEFSLPVENYLDESFGLSADILAADIGCEGGILDSDFGHLGSLKYDSETTTGAVDEVLLSDIADSLGQEWMENVDLKTLLNSYVECHSLQQTNIPPQIPVSLPVSIPTSSQNYDSEPRKEGMKVSAYEKLKALLTGQGQAVEPASNKESTIPTIVVQESAGSPVPSSPVALVPDIQFIAPSFDSLLEESGENVLEELIQLQSTSTNSQFTHYTDTGNNSGVSVVELLSPVTDVTLSNNSDSDSYIASGPPSPADSFILETVDISKLKEEDDAFCSDKSSQISDHEFTKLKSKPKRESVRSIPYEIDVSCIDNKKDRKKVQNKNAATRYRVKKRQEKETLQQQESNLSNKNKELKEKVESLQREISYMKELMNEIYKAKKKQSN